MGSIIGSILSNKKIPTAGGMPKGDNTIPKVVALRMAGPAVLAREDKKLLKNSVKIEFKLIGIW
jgi:hypothetical protein